MIGWGGGDVIVGWGGGDGFDEGCIGEGDPPPQAVSASVRVSVKISSFIQMSPL